MNFIENWGLLLISIIIILAYSGLVLQQDGSEKLNIWVNLLWRKVSSPNRGGRLIYREIFTFKQMLSFLRQAIDRLYQVVDTIYLPSG